MGSGRSGTSAVAHLVRELGVSFGPEEHLRLETAWNTDGCWEHEQLMNINQHIFKRLGGTDVALPVFPADWHRSSEFDDLKAAAKQIIQEDFAEASVWGWKDPTVCLTLPFWQEVVGEMRYVISIRNPVDVIASLEKQWNWSLPTAASSWVERNFSAVTYTTGCQRLFFSFDDYFEKPREHVERLAEFIGQSLPEPGSEQYQRIFGTLRSDLRNFESPTDKVLADERLTDGEKNIYLELIAVCRTLNGQGTIDLARLTEAYRAATRGRYQKLHGFFQAYATEAEAELQTVRQALEDAEARLARVETERARGTAQSLTGVSK